jgi:hypothetical protein
LHPSSEHPQHHRLSLPVDFSAGERANGWAGTGTESPRQIPQVHHHRSPLTVIHLMQLHALGPHPGETLPLPRRPFFPGAEPQLAVTPPPLTRGRAAPACEVNEPPAGRDCGDSADGTAGTVEAPTPGAWGPVGGPGGVGRSVPPLGASPAPSAPVIHPHIPLPTNHTGPCN